MLRNGSKMAKNALNDPIFCVQALKTSYFLITNVIGPIQGGKSRKKIPPPKTPQLGHCVWTAFAVCSCINQELKAPQQHHIVHIFINIC